MRKSRVVKVSRCRFLEDFKAFFGKKLTKYARIVKDSGAKVD